MICAASVVAWNDRLECNNTVCVSDLDASKHRVVNIRGIVRISVPLRYDASIDALIVLLVLKGLQM